MRVRLLLLWLGCSSLGGACAGHGAKPGELRLQTAEKFELAVNLKTAKALGLTISEAFLVRADEVIE